MNKKIITKVFILLFTTAVTCWAGGCAKSLAVQSKDKISTVEKILGQLNQRTKELKSYQGQIEYRVSQPLFESQTLRRGRLYYRSKGGKSALRINFQTLKQDDEKEQKHVEHYIFDCLWLTHIDYQMKEAKRYQLAEPNGPNEPADAFDLVRRRFPIIGFSRVEDLQKEFEIKLAEAKRGEPNDFIELGLKVKPDSIYKNDYTSIDFWIDKKLHLPAKIVAYSTEEDIYQVKFLKPRVNKKLDKKVFDFKIPEDFGKPEIIPLKKTKVKGAKDGG